MRRGSPIRTSSDHSPFIGSPRLIADFHVLHRLLMPRHPPCALEHSHTPQTTGVHESDNTRNTTKQNHNRRNTHSAFPQMLASTIHLHNNTQTPTPTTSHHWRSMQGRKTRKTTTTRTNWLQACSPRTQQRVCPTAEPSSKGPRREVNVMFHP